MKTSYGFIPDNELVTQQMPAFPKEPLNNYINKLIIDKIDKNGFYIECIFNDGKTKILNELTKIEAQYVFNNNLRFKIKGRLSVSLPRCIDPKLAYFVGYFIADGGLIDLNRSYKVSGHYNHKMIVGDEFLLHVSFIADLFENLFGIRCKIRTERIEKGENFYYINPTNKIIYRFLTQLFEMPSGSKTNSVVVPKIILASPIEIQRWFIRGVYDADGSTRAAEFIKPKISSPRIRLKMNSKKFIFEMKKLVGKVFDVSINGVYRDKKDGGWYIQIERMEDIIKLGKANIFIHPIKKWRLDKYIEIKRGL